MDNELVTLIRELCGIASTRNGINTRRHQARFRKNYYVQAIKVVEAHKGSNAKIRHLERFPGLYGTKTILAEEKKKLSNLKRRFPKPAKWLEMGLYKLRSLQLQAAGEYATAKHQTMELSLSTTDRVKYILKAVKGKITYDNGSISNIWINDIRLTDEEISSYAKEHELGTAVGEMLGDKDAIAQD